MADCVFCAIAQREAPAKITAENDDVIAIIPLNPVTPGHHLVIPRRHVESAVTDPELTGMVMTYAAGLAKHADEPCNIITSVGAEATQSVFHLHVHIVPRRDGDGLPLPWTPQQAAGVAEALLTRWINAWKYGAQKGESTSRLARESSEFIHRPGPD